MIVSMTGFGDATAERDGTHYAVEIRSLNNRFFKPVIKLPENVQGLEPEIETLLRERLGRGSITFILKMAPNNCCRGRLSHQHRKPLQRPFRCSRQQIKGLNGMIQIDLASLLQLPGVCQEPRDDSDELLRHGDVIRGLVAKSIDKLDSDARNREGAVAVQRTDAAFARDFRKSRRDFQTRSVRHRGLPQAASSCTRQSAFMSKAELIRSMKSIWIKDVAVFVERAGHLRGNPAVDASSGSI